MIRVLVVDDSALVRKNLLELLSREGLEVVGMAANGFDALQQMPRLKPDVVTLDIDMPVMDGMTCLGFLVERYRQPVVILSTLSEEGSFTTFKALAMGALDFVTKPASGSYLSKLDELGPELANKVRAAARVPRERIRARPLGRRSKGSAASASPSMATVLPRAAVASPAEFCCVVGVGGSTGGTLALESVLGQLPAGFPGTIVVVQHLPRGFSAPFARYLDSVGRLGVKEAEDLERLEPATVYVTPAGVHTRVRRTSSGVLFRMDEEAGPSGYMPSIDVFMYSLAAAEQERAVAVLLSGMGSDGVKGLGAVRQFGGLTLVQDSRSSVVYDMAERALRAGAVDHEVALHRLPGRLLLAVDSLCEVAS